MNSEGKTEAGPSLALSMTALEVIGKRPTLWVCFSKNYFRVILSVATGLLPSCFQNSQSYRLNTEKTDRFDTAKKWTIISS